MGLPVALLTALGCEVTGGTALMNEKCLHFSDMRAVPPFAGGNGHAKARPYIRRLLDTLIVFGEMPDGGVVGVDVAVKLAAVA